MIKFLSKVFYQPRSTTDAPPPNNLVGISTDDAIRNMLNFSRILNSPSGVYLEPIGSVDDDPFDDNKINKFNNEPCDHCGCKTYKKDVSCSRCGAPIAS